MRCCFAALDAIITIGRDVAPLLLAYKGVTRRRSISFRTGRCCRPAIANLAPDNRFRAGRTAQLIVGLSGNLGFTHDPRTVFEAARLLRDNADIHFLLSGWGIGWKELSDLQAAEQLDNVTLLEPVPQASLARIPVVGRRLGHSLSAQHCRACRFRAGSTICWRSGARSSSPPSRTRKQRS